MNGQFGETYARTLWLRCSGVLDVTSLNEALYQFEARFARRPKILRAHPKDVSDYERALYEQQYYVDRLSPDGRASAFGVQTVVDRETPAGDWRLEETWRQDKALTEYGTDVPDTVTIVRLGTKMGAEPVADLSAPLVAPNRFDPTHPIAVERFRNLFGKEKL